MNEFLPDGYRWATPVEVMLARQGIMDKRRTVSIIINSKQKKRLAVKR